LSAAYLWTEGAGSAVELDPALQIASDDRPCTPPRLKVVEAKMSVGHHHRGDEKIVETHETAGRSDEAWWQKSRTKLTNNSNIWIEFVLGA
jgi:hypothetical protein